MGLSFFGLRDVLNFLPRSPRSFLLGGRREKGENKAGVAGKQCAYGFEFRNEREAESGRCKYSARKKRRVSCYVGNRRVMRNSKVWLNWEGKCENWFGFGFEFGFRELFLDLGG